MRSNDDMWSKKMSPRGKNHPTPPGEAVAESIVCANASQIDGRRALDVAVLLPPCKSKATMDKQNLHLSLNIIPDDPEGSMYRFVIVSALRARQLQGGARSVLLPVTMKPTIVAMQEVRRGLIPWTDGAARTIAAPLVDSN